MMVEDIMNNYELAEDEVILYNGSIFRDDLKSRCDLTLTNHRMIFEATKIEKISLFKTKSEKVLVEEIGLESVKIYNGKVQVQQKNIGAYIQTNSKNFTIEFENAFETLKFITKVKDAITGTTLSNRSSEKVKETFDKNYI